MLSAYSGTTDDRPAFQELVRDARQGRFDAIVVHKFDRMALELPKEWQERALTAIDELLNQKQLRDRIEEIKQIIERLDMCWDMEFMNKEEYLQKRSRLQEELKGAQPLPREHLEQALKLFRDFRTLWEGGNPYERKHLLSLVVENVWVTGTEISAITLRSSYYLVVTGLRKAVEDSGLLNADGTPKDGDDRDGKKETTGLLDRWFHGSDGHRLLSGNFLLVILVAAPPSESGFCQPNYPNMA